MSTALPAFLQNVAGISGPSVVALGPATVSDGLSQRAIVKGHGTGVCEGGSVSGSTWSNGTAITFPKPYQNIPVIELFGGAAHEPRYSKWTAGFDPLRPVRVERDALQVSASGFTPRGRFVQETGTFSGVDDNFSANTLDVVDETATVTLSSPPAFDDRYSVRVQVTLNAGGDPGGEPDPYTGNPGKPYTGYVSITLGIEFNDGGGWVERATLFAERSAANSDNDISTHTVVRTVTGMGSTDQVRVRVKSVYVQRELGSASASALDVQYSTVSGGSSSYATLTPDQSANAQDRLRYQVLGVV